MQAWEVLSSKAFRAGDKEVLKSIQIQKEDQGGKGEVQDEAGWKLQQISVREVWTGMKTITSLGSAGFISLDVANELNLAGPGCM